MKKNFYLVGLLMLAACSSAEPGKVNIISGTPDDPHVIAPAGCPNWTKWDGGSNYFNSPTSNFGCANVTNYGLMVEDPNDMIEGKPSGLSSGARAVSSVSAYEAGTVAAPGATSGGTTTTSGQ